MTKRQHQDGSSNISHLFVEDGPGPGFKAVPLPYLTDKLHFQVVKFISITIRLEQPLYSAGCILPPVPSRFFFG